jgi:type II secretory pathway component PulF
MIKKKLQRARKNIRKFLADRLSAKKQIFFAKRVAFLLNAGIPLLECLYILRDQTNSKRYKHILDVMIHDVSNGYTLSKSLAKFPHAFNNFTVNIVKVGESNGTLSQNLNYLAVELNKAYLLKRKTISALIYPAVIAVATLGITGLLSVYIFPKVMPIFTSLKITLPLTTRIMLFTSNFLIHWGLLLILGLILLFIAIYIAVKRFEKFHLRFDRVLLRAPIFGTLARFYNLANCSRTIGLLLKSGARLSETLPIAANTMENRVYKKRLETLVHAVNRGEKISTHLKHDRRLFPDIISQMIAVGESSGSLSDTFIYLSELYDNEVEEYTKNLSSLIEPILMVCMGLVVGFMAVSVITPIYSITQHLQPR